MSDYNYSIESLVDRIHNSKTKDYFREVIQTFYSGSYRSCIVTLYSVVICDLIFKLEELKDIYNDSAATKILKEIEEKQKENPRSPDWESNIIQLIKDRTSLLELFEIDAILQLQKQRHLSAHPILTEISILFTPNKETITAHIKNMLSFVLTKPPIFSRRFATSIIIDISENRDKLIINKYLQRYLEAKYFKNARQELLDNLFKTLWKFTFQTKNEECDTNREINYLALEIIYNRNRDGIEKIHQIGTRKL